jgi:hypothetical protein
LSYELTDFAFYQEEFSAHDVRFPLSPDDQEGGTAELVAPQSLRSSEVTQPVAGAE